MESSTQKDINIYNEFYYSTVCHVCKMKCKNLKYCKNCKVYRYCCVDHQKAHWPIHKQICQTLNKLLIQTNQKSCFAITSENNWVSTRMKVKMFLDNQLHRPLSSAENQVWMFPRVCAVCFKSNDLFECPDCPAVSYCSADHQSLHSNTHTKICSLMKLQYNYYCNKLNDMDCKMDALNINISYDESKNIFDDVNDSNVTRVAQGEKLSHAVTVMSALELSGIYDGCSVSNDNFTIHIVGATYEWSNFDGLVCELIFHWINNLKKIHLVFIGPEMMLPLKSDWNHCESCDHRNVQVIYDFEPVLYSEYFHSKKFEAPNLVAIFNCGFHEMIHTDNDLWEESLPLLIMPGVPLLITSYTRDESLQDLNRLSEIFHNICCLDVLKKCERNPYHSLLPLRDWMNVDEVYYNNYYFSLVKKAE